MDSSSQNLNFLIVPSWLTLRMLSPVIRIYWSCQRAELLKSSPKTLFSVKPQFKQSYQMLESRLRECIIPQKRKIHFIDSCSDIFVSPFEEACKDSAPNWIWFEHLKKDAEKCKGRLIIVPANHRSAVYYSKILSCISPTAPGIEIHL